MLVDANLLLYATDDSSPHHDSAARWLTNVLGGDRRVGFCWTTVGAFVRISTNPRIYRNPLTADQSWDCVRAWLAAEPAWMPVATEKTAAVFGELVTRLPATVGLVPDAMLAALAIEHGLTVISADSDFARFPGVRWHNPLAAQPG